MLGCCFCPKPESPAVSNGMTTNSLGLAAFNGGGNSRRGLWSRQADLIKLQTDDNVD